MKKEDGPTAVEYAVVMIRYDESAILYKDCYTELRQAQAGEYSQLCPILFVENTNVIFISKFFEKQESEVPRLWFQRLESLTPSNYDTG